MSVVRTAAVPDLDACVEIVGEEQARARLAHALSRPEYLFLVAEWAGAPVGFLIAAAGVPEANPTAVIGDFWVEAPGLWPSVGQHLLREARTRLKARGIKQIVATGEDADEAALLASEGLSHTAAGWTAAV